MSKIFKVGDEVVIKEWDEMVKEYGLNYMGNIECHPYTFTSLMKRFCGEEATIIKICSNRQVFLNFKKPDLNSFFILYCMDMIKLKKPQTIVIYQKGNSVFAKDVTTDRVAMAICAPEDEFNFNIGASIAFERLVGKGSIDKARKAINGAKEEKRKEIEIGNSVRITDANKQYINYINFFKDNNMSCELAARYYYGKVIPLTELDDVFEVIAIGLDTRGNKVCVIRNKSKRIYTGYYLFAVDGLKKC